MLAPRATTEVVDPSRTVQRLGEASSEKRKPGRDRGSSAKQSARTIDKALNVNGRRRSHRIRLAAGFFRVSRAKISRGPLECAVDDAVDAALRVLLPRGRIRQRET